MAPTIILDIGFMAMLVVVAFAIVRLKSLFAIVMLQGVYSLVSAAWFVSLDAVDVAFTEAAVGAGVSTVLMLAAMLLADRQSKPVPMRHQLGPLLIVVFAGLAMFYALGDMSTYGDPNSPANTGVGSTYLETTYDDMHIPNVVTAVLASYRGYDTFGEAVVIFAAGLGVLLLLGLNGNAGKWRAQPNGIQISGGSAPAALKQPLPKDATVPTTRRKKTAPKAKPKPKPKPKAKAATTKPAAKKTTTKKSPAKKPAAKKKPTTRKTTTKSSKGGKS